MAGTQVGSPRPGWAVMGQLAGTSEGLCFSPLSLSFLTSENGKWNSRMLSALTSRPTPGERGRRRGRVSRDPDPWGSAFNALLPTCLRLRGVAGSGWGTPGKGSAAVVRDRGGVEGGGWRRRRDGTWVPGAVGSSQPGGPKTRATARSASSLQWKPDCLSHPSPGSFLDETRQKLCPCFYKP